MIRTASLAQARAARFKLAKGPAFAYSCGQQHPPRLSTMRTRGVTFWGFRNLREPMKTPATPHLAALPGGFFMPAIWAAGACR